MREHTVFDILKRFVSRKKNKIRQCVPYDYLDLDAKYLAVQLKSPKKPKKRRLNYKVWSSRNSFWQKDL